MKNKKYVLLLMLIALSLPLTGCVKYNANMDIKKDKSMYFSVIYAFDTSYFDDQEVLDAAQKKELQDAGFIVTDYKDDKMKGFTIAKNIKNIDLVSDKQDTNYSLSGITEKDDSNPKIFKVQKGLFKNTYTANFNFDVSDSQIDSDTTDSNTNFRKALDPSISSDFDESELEENLSKSLDLSFNVTLPYSAISSNASSKKDNNKNLTWDLSSNKVSTIQFKFSLYNMTSIYMIIAVVVIVVLAVIISNQNKSKGTYSLNPEIKTPVVENNSTWTNQTNISTNESPQNPGIAKSSGINSKNSNIDSTIPNIDVNNNFLQEEVTNNASPTEISVSNKEKSKEVSNTITPLMQVYGRNTINNSSSDNIKTQPNDNK